jgi:hypothetical protein
MSETSKEQADTGQRQSNGQFSQGHSGNPNGWHKGSPNKINQTLREAFTNALEELGGQEFLVQFGRDNPKSFITLVSKMLPREINANMTPSSFMTADDLEELKHRASMASSNTPYSDCLPSTEGD